MHSHLIPYNPSIIRIFNLNSLDAQLQERLALVRSLTSEALYSLKHSAICAIFNLDLLAGERDDQYEVRLAQAMALTIEQCNNLVQKEIRAIFNLDLPVDKRDDHYDERLNCAMNLTPIQINNLCDPIIRKIFNLDAKHAFTGFSFYEERLEYVMNLTYDQGAGVKTYNKNSLAYNAALEFMAEQELREVSRVSQVFTPKSSASPSSPRENVI